MQAGRLAGLDVAGIVKKFVERAGLDAAKCGGPLAAGWPCHECGERRGASRRRRCTGLSRWCGGISGTGACSWRIARGSWGYSPEASLDAVPLYYVLFKPFWTAGLAHGFLLTTPQRPNAMGTINARDPPARSRT